MSTLPLSDIVNISVVVSPVATIRSGFNLGLIVGSSTHISASDRVKIYTGTDGMVADGFTSSEAEYKAATLYFSQNPKPTKVAIGRWDKTGEETALEAVTACRVKNTDWYACYLCGAVKADILDIAPYIEAVEPSSVFFYTTADADVLAGTALTSGYETSATAPSTDISGGTATTFQIAVDGDATYHDIALTLTGLDTGLEIAAAMQTKIRALGGIYSAVTVAFTGGVYIITSGSVGLNSSVRIIDGASNDVATALKIGADNGATDTDGTGSIMIQLQVASYKRSLGQYSTSPDAAVSIMGYAMGANTGLANTAYILAYKQEVGVIPEALTETQIGIIKAQGGNYYVTRGNTYNIFQQGVMANGMHFDEIINLDMLKNDIQIAVMDLLTGVSKVPQNEGGVTLLMSVIAGPCNAARNRGFLSPGVWTAPSILNLNTGDALSLGFIILAETISSQSASDRANRIAPPIYVCIKLAGAIEFVSIQITVNR